MPESGYWAVFLVGLMGGAHCLGMCGGIATAQALAIPK
ncbi:MAG TPA: sulfite exporter TauE/SafE family protein, partial [Rhodocyclaceae bacterium]|nr:sulfite exporter TauE/SafE family protein [Rhodocyclaceae bacterium]